MSSGGDADGSGVLRLTPTATNQEGFGVLQHLAADVERPGPHVQHLPVRIGVAKPTASRSPRRDRPGQPGRTGQHRSGRWPPRLLGRHRRTVRRRPRPRLHGLRPRRLRQLHQLRLRRQRLHQPELVDQRAAPAERHDPRPGQRHGRLLRARLDAEPHGGLGSGLKLDNVSGTDTTRSTSLVPVEVAINPSTAAAITQSGMTIPAQSWAINFTPIGTTTATLLTGALPTHQRRPVPVELDRPGHQACPTC